MLSDVTCWTMFLRSSKFVLRRPVAQMIVRSFSRVMTGATLFLVRARRTRRAPLPETDLASFPRGCASTTTCEHFTVARITSARATVARPPASLSAWASFASPATEAPMRKHEGSEDHV